MDSPETLSSPSPKKEKMVCAHLPIVCMCCSNVSKLGNRTSAASSWSGFLLLALASAKVEMDKRFGQIRTGSCACAHAVHFTAYASDHLGE